MADTTIPRRYTILNHPIQWNPINTKYVGPHISVWILPYPSLFEYPVLGFCGNRFDSQGFTGHTQLFGHTQLVRNHFKTQPVIDRLQQMDPARCYCS